MEFVVPDMLNMVSLKIGSVKMQKIYIQGEPFYMFNLYK